MESQAPGHILAGIVSISFQYPAGNKRWKEAKNMVCALGQIDALVRYLPGLRDFLAWYQVQGVNHRAIENHRRRIRLYSGKKDCG